MIKENKLLKDFKLPSTSGKEFHLKKDLKQNLKDMGDSEISFQKMRTAIRQSSEFKNMENIIKRNVPFDASDTIPEIEDIVEFLAGYGANEFYNGDLAYKDEYDD